MCIEKWHFVYVCQQNMNKQLMEENNHSRSVRPFECCTPVDIKTLKNFVSLVK
jgi:hypothetical protein